MNILRKILLFFSPLICKECLLSMSRFWIFITMSHSIYIWTMTRSDISPTEFQVLMLLLGYELGGKVIKDSKISFDKWVDSKQTPEMLKYKMEASKAAKNIDQSVG